MVERGRREACKGGTAEEKGLRKSLLLALILREPMRWVAGEEGPEIRAKED